MKPPPALVGGAQVLRWAAIGDRPRTSDSGSLADGGDRGRPAAGLAICWSEAERSYYLFGCDAEWSSLTDTWHATLRDALDQAELEHEGLSIAWNVVPLDDASSDANEATAPLDEEALTEASRAFAALLFARFPWLRAHAAMERSSEDAAWSLTASAPAPSGEPWSRLVLWMDCGDEPSLGFGGWHTHASCQAVPSEDEHGHAALLDLAQGILDDRLVVCEDFDPPDGPHVALIDLSEDGALLDALTTPGAAGRAVLRSWSGRHDGFVHLGELESEGRA